MLNDQPARSGHLLLLVASGLIAVLIGWDVLSDYSSGVKLMHLIVELALLLLAASMFGYILARMLRGRRELKQLHRRLDTARAESRRWRSRYQSTIRGLSEAIEEQFGLWQLSAAEAQVALLLLKGLSFKEIAAARHTSERTVREQARAAYRKAGLGGRSELAAFFLEDLLLPGARDKG